MDELTTLQILQILVPVVIATIASSGFWIFVGGIKDRRSAQTELLLGIAHHLIVLQGMKYIERGWITQDEYENINLYLYKSYEKLGGNGSAKRVMLEIERLDIKRHHPAPISKSEGDTLP